MGANPTYFGSDSTTKTTYSSISTSVIPHLENCKTLVSRQVGTILTIPPIPVSFHTHGSSGLSPPHRLSEPLLALGVTGNLNSITMPFPVNVKRSNRSSHVHFIGNSLESASSRSSKSTSSTQGTVRVHRRPPPSDYPKSSDANRRLIPKHPIQNPRSQPPRDEPLRIRNATISNATHHSILPQNLVRLIPSIDSTHRFGSIVSIRNIHSYRPIAPSGINRKFGVGRISRSHLPSR